MRYHRSVLRVDVETSRELFQALLPWSRALGDGHWVFRGQGDARWGLVPSLFRRDQYKCCSSLAHVADAGGGVYLAEEEGEHAEQLERAIDHDLMAVLQDQGAAFERTEQLTASSAGPTPVVFPSDERLSLAQHVGLPTRMLDWTRSPWVGLFFAVENVVAAADGRFAVFAMESLYATLSLRMVTSPFIRPSGYGNENFVAQSGVFVRLNAAVRAADDRSGWDMALGHEERVGDARRPGVIDDLLVKFTAPACIAPEIRRLLREWGYHAGRLYPNNAGAAQAVRDLLRDS